MATPKKTEDTIPIIQKLTDLESVILESNEQMGVTIAALATKVDELVEQVQLQKQQRGNPSNTLQLSRRCRVKAEGLGGIVSVQHDGVQWDLRGRMDSQLFDLLTEHASDGGRFTKTSIHGFLSQYGVKADSEKV